jgi:AraC-like DNA-binding protein
LNNPSLQVNILSLAFDCGFNSKSSFNNYFKKITGSTPTAYRRRQLERLIPDTSPSV